MRYVRTMTVEDVFKLVGLCAALLFLPSVIWIDSRRRSSARGAAPPEEPCWTEEMSTDGRLSYGRNGCYHAQLAEMEARARSGEFDTPT